MADISKPDERRVERIMSRVRTNIILRDVLTFGLGRIWLVLLELFAAVYKLFNRGAAAHSGKHPSDVKVSR
ncbi:MAG: hypothetical protein OXI88_08385 [Gammaproteobacteria bacterium]|nr:hypothetical protein [Gammaproteobacteria bacterium]